MMHGQKNIEVHVVNQYLVVQLVEALRYNP